ncbi:glutathione S-transferase family protein [Xanthobacter autotrophicus DSM 431]|uniref:glutathione S-transferase family protein n=1 Tax=Xanthobacter nonsaccharivorans TaxID=3119912 RepID=UPI00372C8CAE
MALPQPAPLTAPEVAQPRLRHAPLSPFARKVVVVAHELGVLDRIEIVPCDVWAPDTDIAGDNPLGKVPALRTAAGAIIGATLICEWLGTLAPEHPLLPQEPAARWAALRAHAVADGIMEAAVTYTMERMRRPQDKIWEGWLERQEGKICRGLAHLAALPAEERANIDLYTLTLGCTLGYLDFRLPHLDWRADHPQLASFEATISERPSLQATAPVRFI